MATKITGKDFESFRAAHDKNFIVPNKIKAGLAALGESWMYEAEFMKSCGISQTDFAAYRDQFAEFYVDVGGRNPKRVWAGTKAFANKLRGSAA